MAKVEWSTLAAEDLDLIDRTEAGRRLKQTLDFLFRLERAHGFFFNWYDPRTGATLRDWPGGGQIRPFLSTVDNGWLAAALIMVGNKLPELRAEAEALLAPMDFRFFYDDYDPSNPTLHPGLMRGGFWTDNETYSDFHYGMLNTETRITAYIGIARGHLPPEHYYRMHRAPMAESDGSSGPTREYLGVPVAEGYRTYRNLRIVPSWDGTMFEALMVTLFVPEADWAPRSWGINHPLYIRAQIEHSLHDERMGYWGVSAASDPEDGYHAFGIAALSARIDARLLPSETVRVVTPHASFLALPFAPREAMANIRALAADFATYGPYGFFDSVDVVTGRVSNRILTLDQGMIMAAIANLVGRDGLQHLLWEGGVGEEIRSLIALEQFEAGIARPDRSPGEEGGSWTDQDPFEIAIRTSQSPRAPASERPRPAATNPARDPSPVRDGTTDRSDPVDELPRDCFAPTDRRTWLQPERDAEPPPGPRGMGRRRRATRLILWARLRGASGHARRRGGTSSRDA